MVFEERPDYKSIQVLFPGNRRRNSASGVFLPPGSRFWELSKDSAIRKDYNNLLGIWYFETDPMHIMTELDKYVLDIAIDPNDTLFKLFLDKSSNVTKTLSNLASRAENVLSSQMPKIEEIYQNYGKVSDGIEIQKPCRKLPTQHLYPMMISREESPVDHLASLKYAPKPKIEKGLIINQGTVDRISNLLPHITKSEEGNYIRCGRIADGLDLLMAAYEVWPDVKEQLRLAEKPAPSVSHGVQS